MKRTRVADRPGGAGTEAWLQSVWRTRGLAAIALLPLSLLYALVVGLRKLAFRWGARRTIALPVPVIVVGNVIAGGAGKTPTVMALVQHLQSQGETPGVISRGYGGQRSGLHLLTARSQAGQTGDEPLLIHRRTGAPTCVGARRVDAAHALLAAHPEVSVIVSDDGLQHLHLARDVEIIVFDERGAGNGWWLPAGPLREGLQRRADAVLYNAPAPSTSRPGYLARRALGAIVTLRDWTSGAAARDGGAGLADWHGQRVLAVAGIAQPQRFFSMLDAAGLAHEALPLPDHHHYDALPWAHWQGECILVTEKDAVKLQYLPAACNDPRVHVVTLDFQPDPAFLAVVDRCLANARRARR